MARKSKFTDKLGKYTAQDEENLALEILEDSRLRGLGIDPDGDSIEILVALDRLVVKHDHEHKAYLETKKSKEDTSKQ